MDLSGSVALVTGGAARIGREISVQFAQRGAAVAVHYRRSEQPAQETRADIEASGGISDLFQADLTDQGDLEELIPAVTRRFGQPNILINSASIYRTAPLADTTRAEWDENMTVHAWVPFRLSQILLQGLGSAPGKIINMNDAHPTRPNRFAYGVSKSALSAITRTLAASAGPNVQVNELALGAILPPPGLSQDRVDAIVERVPAERWGSAEEIVSVVLSLIENDYINGERIHVDGGEMGARW